MGNNACTKRSAGDVGEGNGLGRVARLQFNEEALIKDEEEKKKTNLKNPLDYISMVYLLSQNLLWLSWLLWSSLAYVNCLFMIP